MLYSSNSRLPIFKHPVTLRHRLKLIPALLLALLLVVLPVIRGGAVEEEPPAADAESSLATKADPLLSMIQRAASAKRSENSGQVQRVNAELASLSRCRHRGNKRSQES